MNYNDAAFLTERIPLGDKRALSRAITLVENEDPRALKIERDLYSLTGKAYRVGITGPPGAGKSTLVNVLAKEFKSRGNKVGIIAVDPTSPFTGGALLGDRIRMGAALADHEIFMRSMASRGGTGGLARTTTQVADVMDSFGFDVLIIETVGVGQLELDIAGAVDTTVVVLVPEAGGGVQAMKAGLIEIADIFAINKADRDGAEILKSELQDALSLMPAIKNGSWDLPVKLTVALEGRGVKELVDTVYKHKEHLEASGKFHKNRQSQAEIKIRDIVRAEIGKRLWMNPSLKSVLDSLSGFCVEGKIDPYSAARTFLQSAEAQR
ncbi:MAG: methylmalonyl Co-A mutase-associated GTPase MeaB [Firmicutes bacterium]|nr:methylmalonyl Co-A mutase-associated GTPase MeaB [Bacillota bacterium]